MEGTAGDDDKLSLRILATALRALNLTLHKARGPSAGLGIDLCLERCLDAYGRTKLSRGEGQVLIGRHIWEVKLEEFGGHLDVQEDPWQCPGARLSNLMACGSHMWSTGGCMQWLSYRVVA